MPLKIRDAGTLRTITRLTIRQAGVDRRIKTLKVMDGGVLRTVAVFADPLTASMSPGIVSGRASGTPSVTVITGFATLVKNGGLGPFSYQWTHVGGDAATINSPTSASTNFTTSVSAALATKVGTFRCTVTDAYGSTASATVTASFTNDHNPL